MGAANSTPRSREEDSSHISYFTNVFTHASPPREEEFITHLIDSHGKLCSGEELLLTAQPLVLAYLKSTFSEVLEANSTTDHKDDLTGNLASGGSLRPLPSSSSSVVPPPPLDRLVWVIRCCTTLLQSCYPATRLSSSTAESGTFTDGSRGHTSDARPRLPIVLHEGDASLSLHSLLPEGYEKPPPHDYTVVGSPRSVEAIRKAAEACLSFLELFFRVTFRLMQKHLSLLSACLAEWSSVLDAWLHVVSTILLYEADEKGTALFSSPSPSSSMPCHGVRREDDSLLLLQLHATRLLVTLHSTALYHSIEDDQEDLFSQRMLSSPSFSAVFLRLLHRVLQWGQEKRVMGRRRRRTQRAPVWAEAMEGEDGKGEERGNLREGKETDFRTPSDAHLLSPAIVGVEEETEEDATREPPRRSEVVLGHFSVGNNNASAVRTMLYGSGSFSSVLPSVWRFDAAWRGLVSKLVQYVVGGRLGEEEEEEQQQQQQQGRAGEGHAPVRRTRAARHALCAPEDSEAKDTGGETSSGGIRYHDPLASHLVPTREERRRRVLSAAESAGMPMLPWCAVQTVTTARDALYRRSVELLLLLLVYRRGMAASTEEPRTENGCGGASEKTTATRRRTRAEEDEAALPPPQHTTFSHADDPKDRSTMDEAKRRRPLHQGGVVRSTDAPSVSAWRSKPWRSPAEDWFTGFLDPSSFASAAAMEETTARASEEEGCERGSASSRARWLSSSPISVLHRAEESVSVYHTLRLLEMIASHFRTCPLLGVLLYTLLVDHRAHVARTFFFFCTPPAAVTAASSLGVSQASASFSPKKPVRHAGPRSSPPETRDRRRGPRDSSPLLHGGRNPLEKDPLLLLHPSTTVRSKAASGTPGEGMSWNRGSPTGLCSPTSISLLPISLLSSFQDPHGAAMSSLSGTFILSSSSSSSSSSSTGGGGSDAIDVSSPPAAAASGTGLTGAGSLVLLTYQLLELLFVSLHPPYDAVWGAVEVKEGDDGPMGRRKTTHTTTTTTSPPFPLSPPHTHAGQSGKSPRPPLVSDGDVLLFPDTSSPPPIPTASLPPPSIPSSTGEVKDGATVPPSSSSTTSHSIPPCSDRQIGDILRTQGGPLAYAHMNVLCASLLLLLSEDPSLNRLLFQTPVVQVEELLQTVQQQQEKQQEEEMGSREQFSSLSTVFPPTAYKETMSMGSLMVLVLSLGCETAVRTESSAPVARMLFSTLSNVSRFVQHISTSTSQCVVQTLRFLLHTLEKQCQPPPPPPLSASPSSLFSSSWTHSESVALPSTTSASPPAPEIPPPALHSARLHARAHTPERSVTEEEEKMKKQQRWHMPVSTAAATIRGTPERHATNERCEREGEGEEKEGEGGIPVNGTGAAPPTETVLEGYLQSFVEIVEGMLVGNHRQNIRLLYELLYAKDTLLAFALHGGDRAEGGNTSTSAPSTPSKQEWLLSSSSATSLATDTLDSSMAYHGGAPSWEAGGGGKGAGGGGDPKEAPPHASVPGRVLPVEGIPSGPSEMRPPESPHTPSHLVPSATSASLPSREMPSERGGNGGGGGGSTREIPSSLPFTGQWNASQTPWVPAAPPPSADQSAIQSSTGSSVGISSSTLHPSMGSTPSFPMGGGSGQISGRFGSVSSALPVFTAPAAFHDLDIPLRAPPAQLSLFPDAQRSAWYRTTLHFPKKEEDEEEEEKKKKEKEEKNRRAEVWERSQKRLHSLVRILQTYCADIVWESVYSADDLMDQMTHVSNAGHDGGDGEEENAAKEMKKKERRKKGASPLPYSPFLWCTPEHPAREEEEEEEGERNSTSTAPTTANLEGEDSYCGNPPRQRPPLSSSIFRTEQYSRVLGTSASLSGASPSPPIFFSSPSSSSFPVVPSPPTTRTPTSVPVGSHASLCAAAPLSPLVTPTISVGPTLPTVVDACLPSSAECHHPHTGALPPTRGWYTSPTAGGGSTILRESLQYKQADVTEKELILYRYEEARGSYHFLGPLLWSLLFCSAARPGGSLWASQVDECPLLVQSSSEE